MLAPESTTGFPDSLTSRVPLTESQPFSDTGPLAADAVYLIMKPLEWLFVAVLYLFDAKPEDRIARQYLPKI